MFSSCSNSFPLQHRVSDFCSFLVLGNKANKTIEFYSALHEGIKPVSTTENIATTNTSDFTGTSRDLIRAGALDDTISSDSDDMILDSSKMLI